MKIKHLLQGKNLGHPLHPALVHLPVGLFAGSLIFDILSFFQQSPAAGNFFVNASWYCLLIGVIAAIPTAVTGLSEFLDLPANTRVQRIGLTHLILNVVLVVGYAIQLFARDTNAFSVGAGSFVFNLVEFALLGYSGYLGGRMAYEFGVGSRTSINPEGEEHPRRAA